MVLFVSSPFSHCAISIDPDMSLKHDKGGGFTLRTLLLLVICPPFNTELTRSMPKVAVTPWPNLFQHTKVLELENFDVYNSNPTDDDSELVDHPVL